MAPMAQRLAAGDHLAALAEVHRQHRAIATGLEVEKQRAVLGHGATAPRAAAGELKPMKNLRKTYERPIFHGTIWMKTYEKTR